MPRKKGHQAYLDFISRVTELTADYSLEDLRSFFKSASHGFPIMVNVVEAYLVLATSEQGTTKAKSFGKNKVVPQDSPKTIEGSSAKRENVHLFDLLRSKELFPTNSDLAGFAGRIFPRIDKRRFNKMSRGDIAARIIEHLETLNSQKRVNLEASMRKAISTISDGEPRERESFFSQWEKIIKGLPI